LVVGKKGESMNDVGIFVVGCFVTLMLAYSVYLDLKDAKQKDAKQKDDEGSSVP
jgi:hypothetical protein